MRINMRILAILVGMGILVAAPPACSLKKNPPEKRFFVLEANRPGRPQASGMKDRPGNGVFLQITRFQVSPRFESKGIVYRTGEVNYEVDFYNEFLVNPANLLTEETAKWLSATDLFDNVIPLGRNLGEKYALAGRVNSLYGDYQEKGNFRGVMEIEYFLMRDPYRNVEIILNKKYHQEAPMDDGSATALVKAWNHCLEAILADLERDLGSIKFSPREN